MTTAERITRTQRLTAQVAAMIAQATAWTQQLEAEHAADEQARNGQRK